MSHADTAHMYRQRIRLCVLMRMCVACVYALCDFLPQHIIESAHHHARAFLLQRLRLEALRATERRLAESKGGSGSGSGSGSPGGGGER